MARLLQLVQPGEHDLVRWLDILSPRSIQPMLSGQCRKYHSIFTSSSEAEAAEIVRHSVYNISAKELYWSSFPRDKDVQPMIRFNSATSQSVSVDLTENSTTESRWTDLLRFAVWTRHAHCPLQLQYVLERIPFLVMRWRFEHSKVQRFCEGTFKPSNVRDIFY